MARKRVVAYFMHEGDRDEVIGRLTSIETTDSFAVGEIEEEDIAELRNQGIVVQVQPSFSTTGEEQRSPAMSIGPADGADGSSQRFPDAIPAAVDYYIVKLNGPLIEPWREQLDAANVTLLEAKGDGGYKAV